MSIFIEFISKLCLFIHFRYTSTLRGYTRVFGMPEVGTKDIQKKINQKIYFLNYYPNKSKAG